MSIEPQTIEPTTERAEDHLASRAAEHGSPQRRTAITQDLVARYGLLVALLLTIAVFSALRPDSFATVDNLRAVLNLAAPLLAISLGLTVVLVMEDFDLSIAAMLGLASATAILLMGPEGVPWQLAVLIAFGIAVVGGAVNGAVIAYLGASSFIITLATSTIFTGTEFLLTDQRTIFEGIPEGYSNIATTTVLGLNLPIWIMAFIAFVLYGLLQHTEAGRYMYAIGGNPEAARLSGVPVERLRLIGFILSALGAALAGILITAEAASSTPNAGVPFLLPAFSAVFLGTAAFRPGQFNVPGTIVGVLFLGVIQTGLIMLSLSTAAVNIVQGVILAAAVLVTREVRRR